MKRRPVTNHEREEMRRLRAKKMSITAIADEMGRTEPCVFSHVRDMDIRLPHGPKRWPEAKVKRFLNAHANREPVDELGPRFGISPISVRPTASRLRRRMQEVRA